MFWSYHIMSVLQDVSCYYLQCILCNLRRNSCVWIKKALPLSLDLSHLAFSYKCSLLAGANKLIKYFRFQRPVNRLRGGGPSDIIISPLSLISQFIHIMPYNLHLNSLFQRSPSLTAWATVSSRLTSSWPLDYLPTLNLSYLSHVTLIAMHHLCKYSST